MFKVFLKNTYRLPSTHSVGFAIKQAALCESKTEEHLCVPRDHFF